MYTLKIRKVGNSAGVTLPKSLLAELKVKEGDRLVLTECAEGFLVTRYSEAFEAQMAAFEKGNRKYRNALRILAK